MKKSKILDKKIWLVRPGIEPGTPKDTKMIHHLWLKNQNRKSCKFCNTNSRAVRRKLVKVFRKFLKYYIQNYRKDRCDTSCDISDIIEQLIRDPFCELKVCCCKQTSNKLK